MALAARPTSPHHQPVPPEEALPLVYVLLAAFNEEEVIADRIRNLQSVDYPPDKLIVLLGTDGCTDETAAAARNVAQQDTRIRVLEFAENEGKVAVLRKLVAETEVEQAPPHLLLFTDANTMFAPDAVRRLVTHFGDARIGGACGRLVFTETGNASENPAEEGAYWRLETKLKTWESSLDSCLGANGAIYAIRPELFWKAIPTNTIVDDFVIGLKVREQGYHMRYDPDAIAAEELPAVEDEWVRRVRIGAGDYQAAVLCKACLHPRFRAFAWSFWSHKIFRWLMPHVLLVMALISFLVAGDAWLRGIPFANAWPAYAVAMGLTTLVLIGRVGVLLRNRNQGGRTAQLCSTCDHFVVMHAALLAGFVRYLGGNMSGTWKRTPRG